MLDPGDAAVVAHFALCVPQPSGVTGAVVVDPLRLPFVEALFDVAIVASVLEATDSPALLLREMRRVIAPAGSVWVIAPRRWLSLGHGVPGHHFSRARLERLLVEAMLEPIGWESFGGWYLVRATPSGGAAAARIGRVSAAERRPLAQPAS